MAESTSIRAPRASTPRWYSMPSDGAHAACSTSPMLPSTGSRIHTTSASAKLASVVISATFRACLPDQRATAAPTTGSTVNSVNIGNPLMPGCSISESPPAPPRPTPTNEDTLARARSAFAPAIRRQPTVLRNLCRSCHPPSCYRGTGSTEPSLGSSTQPRSLTHPKLCGQPSPKPSPTSRKTQPPLPRRTHPRKAGRATDPRSSAQTSPLRRVPRASATFRRRSTNPTRDPGNPPSSKSPSTPSAPALKMHADQTQRRGEEGKNRQRRGHHSGALQRGLLSASLTKEDISHLPRHVEGGQQSAKHQHVKWPLGHAPMLGRSQNAVLAPEA